MLLDGPISPMLATPGRALPDGDGWALEPKWDGEREVAIACEAERGRDVSARRGSER